MAVPKLTSAELATLRLAFNLALEERESFADGHGMNSNEAKTALAQADRIEALFLKLFGSPSDYRRFREAGANQPTISVLQAAGGRIANRNFDPRQLERTAKERK